MLRALDEFVIKGIPTTIPAHRLLLESPEFVDGTYSTQTVEGGALEPLMARTERPDGDAGGQAVLMVRGARVKLWNPAVAGSMSAASRAGSGSGKGTVVAPMHGTILRVLVSEGDAVKAGDPVALLETMKMETHVSAATAGTVRSVSVEAGTIVEAGEVVATVG
jgi:acetyl-CoA/propionyl-CoA carboxylase biotin carboxyl carrier protein